MVDLIQQKIRAQEEKIKHLEKVMNLCEDKVGMVAVSCQVAILTRKGFICELRELL